MKQKNLNTRKRSSKFLKYSTLASQMFITILVGVFFGKYIDEKMEGNGVYMALIAVLSVIVAIYLGIKDLIRQK